MKNEKSKILGILWRVLFVIAIVAIIATFSRTGFILLSITFIMFLTSFKYYFKTSNVIKILLVLSIVLFIAPQEYWKRMETLITWEDTGEGNLYRWGGGAGRLLMWEQGFEIFLKHPFTGVGFLRYNYARIEYFGVYSGNRSHNAFINILVETGLLGLTLFIGIYIAGWLNIKRIRQKLIYSGCNFNLIPLMDVMKLYIILIAVGSLFLDFELKEYLFIILAVTVSVKNWNIKNVRSSSATEYQVGP